MIRVQLFIFSLKERPEPRVLQPFRSILLSAAFDRSTQVAVSIDGDEKVRLQANQQTQLHVCFVV